jgi:hypothetical protein
MQEHYNAEKERCKMLRIMVIVKANSRETMDELLSCNHDHSVIDDATTAS